jgi:hypothetical protein
LTHADLLESHGNRVAICHRFHCHAMSATTNWNRMLLAALACSHEINIDRKNLDEVVTRALLPALHPLSVTRQLKAPKTKWVRPCSLTRKPMNTAR